MCFIVIIRGPLGIGKSTIAKQIADKINGEYISVDEVLAENHLDQVDETLGCISETNFLEANKIIQPKLNQAILKKMPIVVDGNFYHQNQIEDLIKSFPKIFVFTLTAPLGVCIQRDSQRQNPYGVGAATAVYNLVSKINYGESIDTADLSIEETVKVIESKIT